MLDIDPNAIVAANNLAWMMAEDNENIDEACGRRENHVAETARKKIAGRSTTKEKGPPAEPRTAALLKILPAATYSPTHLRTQYHRRWQA